MIDHKPDCVLDEWHSHPEHCSAQHVSNRRSCQRCGHMASSHSSYKDRRCTKHWVGSDFKTIEIPRLPDGSADWDAVDASRCPCPGYIPPDPSTIAPKKPPKQKSVRCTHCRGGWISGGSP